MINHLNLSYFICAAREMNFTKASEKLYISQQALSSHISSIEKELGVPLFERGQTLKLTYAGAVFLRYALELEDCYHRMNQELSDVKNEMQGELSLGISHTRGRFILPQLLPPFIKKNPKIRVRILEGNTEELTSALLHGEIDLAIGQPRPNVPELTFELVHVEEIVLVIAASLLAQWNLDAGAVKQSLECDGRLSILQHIPFLLNKKGNATRFAADEIFRREGIVPHILIETENIETLGELCRHALGAAFYPSSLLDQTLLAGSGANEIRLFRLNMESTHLPLAVIYRKNIYQSRALLEMIRQIRQLLQH